MAVSVAQKINNGCEWQAHRLFLFIWQFCVPLVVCIIAYWKIFGVVCRQAQVATERHRTTATTAKGQVAAGTSGGTTRGTNAGPTKQEKGAKKEAVAVGSSGQQQTGGLSQAKLNVIRTMAYVLACFIVCFMPKNLYLTYKNLSVRESSSLCTHTLFVDIMTFSRFLNFARIHRRTQHFTMEWVHVVGPGQEVWWTEWSTGAEPR